MKKEQIGDFTRRITQSNRSGLVVVIYDIFFAYLDDAAKAYGDGQWEDYKDALRKASRVLDELMSALDFRYELAGELYSIYVFCRDSLARSMYRRKPDDMDHARRLMEKVYLSQKLQARDDMTILVGTIWEK